MISSMYNKKRSSQLTSFIASITVLFMLSACDDNIPAQSEFQTVSDKEINLTSDNVAKKQPNFLLIVADDLGYSDLGAFGGEIDTPNLDKLAYSGLRLTSFYTSPACASTRAMLMTGVDNHLAGMGAVEFLFPAQRGQPGYELSLNVNTPTIAEHLKEAGYTTIMSGKWHLGKSPEARPHNRGFMKSFALLDGGHNHYEAMGLSPVKTTYMENGAEVEWPKGKYSSNYFTDKLIELLKDREGEQRPFFGYLTFTAPHWPLQAPRDLIEKYQGRYAEGPQVIAQRRLALQKKLGIVAENTVPHELDLETDWSLLSPQEKAMEAQKMAVYAAMVDSLDHNVGRVMAELDAQGELENTYIIFLSDNGAESMFGDYDGQWGFSALKGGQSELKSGINNTLENLGAPDSFFAYGSSWAHVGEVPSRLFKTFTTEGGIRNAAFITGPGIDGGGVTDTFLHVADIFPTLVDLGSDQRVSSEHDSSIPNAMGHSWKPLLLDRKKAVYGPEESIGWELFGGAALRRGAWKITYIQDFDPGRKLGYWGAGHWELFNIMEDRGETKNLSDAHPALFRDLIDAWAEYADKNGVVLLSPETQVPVQSVKNSAN